MTKTLKLISITAIMILTTCTLSIAQGTHSGQAANHSGAAGSHASKSLAHSIAASGQAVSAAGAIPLMSAGAVSTDMGNALWDAATTPVDGPLEITEETVTVGPPPDKALKPSDM